MKFRRLALAILSLGVLFSWSNSTFAADDPSIKGELRANIQEAMALFIVERAVGGVYRHYDPVTNELLRLEFREIHSGIVKKGDFYVSCADFTDQRGRLVGLDILVIPAGEGLRATQAVVHKIGGEERLLGLAEPEEP